MIKKLTLGLLALVVGLTGTIFTNQVAAQTTNNTDCLLPTSNVGIVTCGTSQTVLAPTTSNTGKKYNPGHYVTLDGPNVALMDDTVASNKDGAAFVQTLKNSGVKGIMVRYRWKELESAKDTYTLSKVKNHLDLTQSFGLKLIVLIEDKNFHGLPTPLPAYLMANDDYYYKNVTDSYNATRWNSFVNTRMKALVNKLGDTFDSHPALEGIGFQETAINLPSGTVTTPKYTPELYRDSIIDVLNTASDAFPKSNVFWYMNYLSGNQDYLGDIGDLMAKRKNVVIGGPDIVPEDKSFVRMAMPFYSQFKNNGSRLFGSAQNDSYRHVHVESKAAYSTAFWTPLEMFIYGRDEMHLNYMFWNYKTWITPATDPKYGGPGEYVWADAIPVIKANPTFNPTTPQRFTEGQRVQTNTANVNIRSTSTLAVIGTQAINRPGTILFDSYRHNINNIPMTNNQWWKVNFDAGIDGTINDEFLSVLGGQPPSNNLPDVVVTSLNYNQSTHTFTAVVKNQGTASTPASQVIGVGYFVDGVQRTWGSINAPLLPGSSITIGTSLLGDKAGPYTISNGTHNIRAWVDDINRFPESNESNNDLTKSITVGGGTGVNVPPTVSGSPATSVAKNAAYNFIPNATDTNGDPLTFVIQNKPAWATFNTSTGRLSGTPTVTGTHANIRISVTDGKSTAVFLPAFTLTVTNTPVTPPPGGGNVGTDKWHPGIYIKIEDWQLRSQSEMNEIYNELETTPQIRGIKVVAMWGRHETKNAATGAVTYNFQQIDTILERLSRMNNKHLILLVPWREFDGNSGSIEIVPNDLRTGSMWNGNTAWRHMDYDYLWAYKQTANPAPGNYNYGYEIKLWNPTIMTRLDKFIEALAKHVDDHPNFNMITTNESAGGEPVISFVAGEGHGLQEAGQKKIYLSMRKHFTKSYVVPAFNFSRPFVKEVIPLLQDNKMGLGSPNMNKQEGLNLTGSTPGVLTYYPKLSGQLILAPEIQGVDLRSTYGPNTAIDNPSYESLYKRVRDDLKANYLVIQRNVPFWEGGRSGNETVPSLLNFLKTYPAIKNDPTGAGGLDHNKPDMVQ